MIETNMLKRGYFSKESIEARYTPEELQQMDLDMIQHATKSIRPGHACWICLHSGHKVLICAPGFNVSVKRV